MTHNFIGLSDEYGPGDFIGHMSFLERKIIRCSPDCKRDTWVSPLDPTWSVWLKLLCKLWVWHSGGLRSLRKWGSAHLFPKIRGSRRGPRLENIFFITLRVVGARSPWPATVTIITYYLLLWLYFMRNNAPLLATEYLFLRNERG